MTRWRLFWVAHLVLALTVAGCRGEPVAPPREGSERGPDAPAQAPRTPSNTAQVSERVSTAPETSPVATSPTIERREASDSDVFRPRGQREGVRPAVTRRDLHDDEARGGHTIERHVGKTDDELRARLARERQISAASTYTDIETAEATVAAVLTRQSGRIADWSGRRGPRPNLALDHKGQASVTIGRSIRRGSRRAEPCVDAVVVLRWDERRMHARSMARARPPTAHW